MVPVVVADCVEERELKEDNDGVIDDFIEAVTEALPDKSADVDTLALIEAKSVAGEFKVTDGELLFELAAESDAV
jgi:hypothetical protein